MPSIDTTALVNAQATKATEDADLALAQTDADTAETAVRGAAFTIGQEIRDTVTDKPSLLGFMDGLCEKLGTETVSTHTKRLRGIRNELRRNFEAANIEWE